MLTSHLILLYTRPNDVEPPPPLQRIRIRDEHAGEILCSVIPAQAEVY